MPVDIEPGSVEASEDTSEDTVESTRPPGINRDEWLSRLKSLGQVYSAPPIDPRAAALIKAHRMDFGEENVQVSRLMHDLEALKLRELVEDAQATASETQALECVAPLLDEEVEVGTVEWTLNSFVGDIDAVLNHLGTVDSKVLNE
jgi:hypothetical protein